MPQRRDARERGQSLLEAIVAIGIIIAAAVGSLSLVAGATNASKESEAAIMAGNLAREGIEIARAVRDTNWLAARPFDAGLYSATDYTAIPTFVPATAAWTFDFSPTTIAEDRARLYRYSGTTGNATLGLWVQAPAQPPGTALTQFRRLITLDALCDNGLGGYAIVSSGSNCGAAKKIGVRAQSTVRWTVGRRTHLLTAEERLFDWR